MKRIALFSLFVGCSTPKDDADDSGLGGAVEAGSTTTDGGEEAGGETTAGTDGGTTEGGTADGNATGGSEAGDSEAGGGETEAGTTGSGSTGGSDTEGGESTGSGTSDGGSEGGEEGGDEGGDDGDAGDTGGTPGGECSVDFLKFSATVSDDDGECSTPCSAEDDLNYKLVIENDSFADCVLTTSSTCLIASVQIDVDTHHDVDPVVAYAPLCARVITDHTIVAGGFVEETFEGYALDAGNYILSIRADMDSILATGSKAFSVE